MTTECSLLWRGESYVNVRFTVRDDSPCIQNFKGPFYRLKDIFWLGIGRTHVVIRAFLHGASGNCDVAVQNVPSPDHICDGLEQQRIAVEQNTIDILHAGGSEDARRNLRIQCATAEEEWQQADKHDVI